MSGQLFISLLNPAIDLAFAAVFLFLWLNRRERYIAYAALAYLATALAFLILDVAPALPMELHRLPANMGFLAAAMFLAAAIIRRYGLPVPWRAMMAVAGVSLAFFTWHLLVDPGIAARIYSISAGAGAIALMIVHALRPIDKPHLIDRVLFWVSVLTAINLIVRPLVIFAFVGSFSSYVGFQQSIYWTTVQFSQAMVSVATAVGLMVAVAIDLIAELRTEADADPLSGLLNRRGFEGAAGAMLRRCIDESRPVALLIADLDDFKQVNDRHGHAVGDAIIAAFGAHVRALGSGEMVAGRIGGEEFALLLPGMSIEAARRLAEVIRIGLPTACSDRIPPSLVPTTSIGLAAGAPGEGLPTLMRRADQALYDAKRAGRNRVRAYRPEPVLAVIA